MGADVRIVGVCLLRNEEYFAAWALMNIAAFCDRIIVMDNRSEDRTRRIVEAVADRHPHIDILDVKNPRRTHRHLESLAGTRTWVFGVDGDEIYDPAGLAILRKRLLAADYADCWRLAGHAVHALGVRLGEGRAFGYSQPHVKSMVKLCNFHAIESWQKGNERMHGGKIVFRPGYGEATHDLWKHEAWSGSVLRCLHLCFMPRSSMDNSSVLANGEFGRRNPAELQKERFLIRRLSRSVRRYFNPGIMDWRDYKRLRYARGPVSDFDISGFGAPSDFHAFDPDCGEAMAVLRAVADLRERKDHDAAAA